MNFLDKIFRACSEGENASYDLSLKRGDYAAAVPLLKEAVRQDDERAMGLMATLMVFGRDGELALRHFGHMDELSLGIVLGERIAQPHAPPEAG